MFNKFFGHLRTINTHKCLVMKTCFKLGMYKQGLLHDLSKYSPSEFIPGVKYYHGSISPNNLQRQKEGCSTAWLHHKGRNKHHLEYWIDYSCDPTKGLQGMKMPTKYVIEMFVDRISACKNYQKQNYTDASALKYYSHGKGRTLINKDSANLLEQLLTMLAKNGEDYTLKYIKKNLLH